MNAKSTCVSMVLGFTLAAVAPAAHAQAQAPAAPAAPAASAAAPSPQALPDGAKVAYVFVNQVTGQSAQGKAALARITALQQKKQAELQAKQAALQTMRQKLADTASVLSDPARDQLAKDADKAGRDLERGAQDAREEIDSLTRELQADFEKRLMPLIGQIATERGLHLVFSLENAGLLWYDPKLDLTPEVVKRLDAVSATSTAKP